MYLRLNGVNGDISDGKYRGCFELEYFSWGVGRSVYPNGKKREISSQSCSEISVVLKTSPASILITALSLVSAEAPLVEILICDSIITLASVVLSGYSVSDDEDYDDGAEISVTLNFVSISFSQITEVVKPIIIPPTVQGLPSENKDAFLKILQYLKQRDIYNLSLTSKTWLKLCEDSSLLFKVGHTWFFSLQTHSTFIDGFELPKLKEDVASEVDTNLEAKIDVYYPLEIDPLAPFDRSLFNHIFDLWKSG